VELITILYAASSGSTMLRVRSYRTLAKARQDVGSERLALSSQPARDPNPERCLLRKNLRLRCRLAEPLERVRFRRRDLQRHFAWKDRRNLLARHVTNMCRLLGLDGEAVEYVVVLVACNLDDFADEDSVGADDIPALLDLQPRDRVSHAGSSPDRGARKLQRPRGAKLAI
jgi:hypothetical protein